MMLTKYGLTAAIIIVFCFGVGYSQIGSPDSLSLDKAIHMAINTYPSIQASKASITAADAQIVQNQSGYYPTVDGVVDYARLSPISEFTLPGVGTIPLYPANNYDFHVGARQTLYDFGKRSVSVENARSNKETALENAESIKSALAYQVVDIFHSILYLQENTTVLKKQIDALEEHLDITQKRLRAGTITDFEVLTTQVRIANTRNQIVDNSAMLANQISILKALIGVGSDAQLTINGDFNSDSIAINPDSLKTLALNNLPELKSSRSTEHSADLQYRLEGLHDRPSLTANLVFGIKNGYTPNMDKLRANWIAGLGLQAPIFNGFLTRGRKDQAAANISAAKYRTQDLERRAISAVEQAMNNVKAAQERLATSELQVAQADQAVSLAQTRYKSGTATNLDLLDAETALANARLVRLKALYDIAKSRYALMKTTGAVIW
jgi:outer membrane protein